MAKNGYIVTRSNYTEKKKHKLLQNSDIYERDYMATTNLGGWDSDSIPYSEGNFKIITHNVDSSKKKHKYGNWLVNEHCSGATDAECEFFTLDNIPSQEETTVETKIESKPNKNSLLDFAYYGSCEALIDSSIDNIVSNYPGELFVTNRPFEYINSAGTISMLGGGLLVVDNPFNIDIVSQSNALSGNPIYYFCDSVNKYVVINSSGNSFNITSWEVTDRSNVKVCFNDGEKIADITIGLEDGTEIIIYQYYLDHSKFLLTTPEFSSYRIRPNNETIENVFTTKFDLFDNFLLNRDSKPLYKIDLDVPNETDRGILIIRKSYTWPTVNGWNLDVYSDSFKRYYTELNSVARWYDENRTDNLWRNMVHEAIKNMDNTVVDTIKNEDASDYRIGINSLRGLMFAYGKQFDDIKLSIDNIKNTNTVTYSENNNTPDYFLTDQANLSGWEVKSVVETLDKKTIVKDLYPFSDKEYKAIDANLCFLRNLKLNSRCIFTRKGTKQAIEMTLALFGYNSYDWAKKYYQTLSNAKKPKRGRRPYNFDDLPSDNAYAQYDYKLDEYVVTVKNNIYDVVPVDETLPIETYNSYKKNYNGQESTVEGLPVRIVYLEYTNSGVTEVYKYIVPWFDKEADLDGNPYFQMYGGWEKEFKKKVVPNRELYPNVDTIYDTTGFTIFNETKKYLKVVENIEDLINIDANTLKGDDAIYVTDISNIENFDSGATISAATNYFTIKDTSNCYFCGVNEEGKEGWKNISKLELSCEGGATDDAYRVIYLENIIEENKGNNPHIGYGKYDNGETYINFFRQLFKGAIENDLFGDDAYDCETGEILDAIKNTGFENVEETVDNVKAWYFTDTLNGSKIYKLIPNEIEVEDDEKIYTVSDGYVKDEFTDDEVNVGLNAYNNNEVGFTTEMSPFNMETQRNGSNDESAANSIINTKKLVLKFNEKYKDNDEFYDYINTCVLPFIEQVVPTTTIFEVKFGE